MVKSKRTKKPKVKKPRVKKTVKVRKLEEKVELERPPEHHPHAGFTNSPFDRKRR